MNKMKLVALHVYRWQQSGAVLLCADMDLSALYFFQRGMAKEHVNFNSRLIASKTPPNNKQSITLEQDIGVCYCWTTTDGISATAICTPDYPEKGAFTLLYNLIMAFRDDFQATGILDKANNDQKLNWPQLEVFLRDWQDPTKADKLMKVEKELFDVTEIMKKNLQDLMDRGETIDDLMAKSKDLNDQSV